VAGKLQDIYLYTVDDLKSVVDENLRGREQAAEAALEHYRDEEIREGFYLFFRELQDLYEIISPDPFLRKFMDDYQRIADLYALLRAAFDAGKPVDRELANKTARLVQEHTETGAIHDSVEVFEIGPDALERIAESDQSDTVKVFNLIKSIAQKIQEEAGKAPYLLSIGERAELIAEAFKLRQLSTQQTLEQLKELIREINEAERKQAEKNIAGEPFAVFYLLKAEDVPEAAAEAAARQVAEDLRRLPHWHTSDQQERELRRKLYALLDEIGVKSVPETVMKIMKVLLR